MKPRKKLLLVAFGGGRNGAMLLGMYERGIVPDVITFSNTGTINKLEGEKPQTYKHVDLMSKWCVDHFGVPITTVHKSSMYKSLYDQCMKTSTLPSAAYGLRSCSDKWKIQPQDRFMNHYGPAIEVWNTCSNCGCIRANHERRRVIENGDCKRVGEKIETYLRCAGEFRRMFTPYKVEKALGFDAGEQHRAKFSEDSKYIYKYFLIEWGWYLEDCIAAYKRHGIPEPDKSACYYCPSTKKHQVIQLYNERPDLFWSAVAMEDNAIASGSLVTVKGLGRNWTWRELIGSEYPDMLPDPPRIACVCMDSEDE